MPHPINRRQTPGWKQARRPLPPPRPSGYIKKGPGHKAGPGRPAKRG